MNNEDYMSDDDGSFSSNNEDPSAQKLSPELNNSSAVDSGSKQDGARKRKRANPVRLPSVPDDSNDEFCCYDDGTVVSNENENEDRDSTNGAGSPKRFKVENGESTPQADAVDEIVSPVSLKESQKSPVRSDGEIQTSPSPKKENESSENASGALDLALNLSPKSKIIREEDAEVEEDKATILNGTHPVGSGNHRDGHDSEEEDEQVKEEEGEVETGSADYLGRLKNLPIFSTNSSQQPIVHESDSSDMCKSDDEENTGRSIGSPNSTSKSVCVLHSMPSLRVNSLGSSHF
jgi:hypothetical protein